MCIRDSYDAGLWSYYELLRDSNIFFRLNLLFSSHCKSKFSTSGGEGEAALLQRFAKAPPDELKVDLFIKYLPLWLFLLGIIVSVTFKGLFGLPMLAAASGIFIKIIYNFTKTNKTKENQFINHSKVGLSGNIIDSNISGVLETSSFLIETKERIVPLQLRQLTRSEAPLLFMAGEVVDVMGVMKYEEIPFIDIGIIKSYTKEGGKIRSSYVFMQLFITAMLAILGYLLLFVEFRGFL